MIFLTTAFFTLIGASIAMPIFLAFMRLFNVYLIVQERQCIVLELFGHVRLVLDEPGLHLPWIRIGPFAALVPFFGKKHVVDLRLDQTYLRSQPVNSEEGAPMGIGIWYEMYVSDPVAFLYKNADPAGSLRTNVSNATVRSLSNMKLQRMLEERHEMSRTVREEVSIHSNEWGYQTGSVYIRKVHFRDLGMINQIEQKVVNRLRQVTAAIQQDGQNREAVIRSTADRQAAVEFAKAATVRPKIVGDALAQVSADAEVARALFEVLETQKMLESQSLRVSLLPPGTDFAAQLQAVQAPPR
jgi:regulator of protease activity HflC (stomatin/prohibitin superfamily)